MPPAGFEPIFTARERPQTHSLDRAATGPGISLCCFLLLVADWRSPSAAYGRVTRALISV
jgi:hypothetical protein